MHILFFMIKYVNFIDKIWDFWMVNIYDNTVKIRNFEKKKKSCITNTCLRMFKVHVQSGMNSNKLKLL